MTQLNHTGRGCSLSTDVQLTRDLVPVLFHDYSLSETGTDVPIHDVTLNQVRVIQ